MEGTSRSGEFKAPPSVREQFLSEVGHSIERIRLFAPSVVGGTLCKTGRTGGSLMDVVMEGTRTGGRSVTTQGIFCWRGRRRFNVQQTHSTRPAISTVEM